MVLIYFVILASFLNMFLQIPLTPMVARSLTADMTLVALAVSAYSISNLAGNLFSGLVVDRVSKRLVVASGLGLGALSLFACGAADRLWVLVLLLLVNGAALSVVTPAAYVLLSQYLNPEERGMGMARSGAAIGLAALIGPPAAGRLADKLGTGGAYQVIGAFLGLAALWAFWKLREDKVKPEADVGLRDLWCTLMEPRLAVPFLGAFSLMYANGGLIFSLPPHVKGMGYSMGMVGALFSTFALSAMIFFLTPLGRKLARNGSVSMLSWGGLLLAIGLIALVPGRILGALFGAMAIYGLGFGLVFSASLTALVNQASPAQRGTAFGVFYAVFSLGAIAAPFVLSMATQLQLSPFVLAALVPAAFALGMGLLAMRSSGPSRLGATSDQTR